jgi:hypothetical protein
MERGEARKTERWEGRWREDGERESKGDREMGGKIAWLYPAGKAFSENRETERRREEQRGERGNHSSVYSL